MRVTAQADTSFVPPGAPVPPTRTGELCSSTPCIADLPVGRYKLYLSSADGTFLHGDTDQLDVTEGLTYYVRAPGHYEPPTWLAPLPLVLVITGAALLTTGLVMLIGTDQDLHTPGYFALGGGFALGTWGAFETYDASRAKQQAGATTVWKP